MSFDAFRQKMQSAGLGDLAIKAFELNYNRMAGGESTLIPEASIKPATGLTSFDDLPEVELVPPEHRLTRVEARRRAQVADERREIVGLLERAPDLDGVFIEEFNRRWDAKLTPLGSP